MTKSLNADELDGLVRRSPTALAAALERAISTGDRALERGVLLALGEIGVVVVDRRALAEALLAGGRR